MCLFRVARARDSNEKGSTTLRRCSCGCFAGQNSLHKLCQLHTIKKCHSCNFLVATMFVGLGMFRHLNISWALHCACYVKGVISDCKYWKILLVKHTPTCFAIVSKPTLSRSNTTGWHQKHGDGANHCETRSQSSNTPEWASWGFLEHAWTCTLLVSEGCKMARMARISSTSRNQRKARSKQLRPMAVAGSVLAL